MATTRGLRLLFLPCILFFLAASAFASPAPTPVLAAGEPSAYEMLEGFGFPRGILPVGVTGYKYRPSDGAFEGGSIRNLGGVSVRMFLFNWGIDRVIMEDPDHLMFYVGPLSQAFPADGFEESPECRCRGRCRRRCGPRAPWVTAALAWRRCRILPLGVIRVNGIHALFAKSVQATSASVVPNTPFAKERVDFNDRTTLEFLFKDYWEIVKDKEGLTQDELEQAYAYLKGDAEARDTSEIPFVGKQDAEGTTVETAGDTPEEVVQPQGAQDRQKLLIKKLMMLRILILYSTRPIIVVAAGITPILKAMSKGHLHLSAFVAGGMINTSPMISKSGEQAKLPALPFYSEMSCRLQGSA
ncbi:hypothetical protein PR202_gb01279 [Eleusine coracana subsp. coracana]|uniref:Uncharacterized protein n=1 Tax=Eleusine coracana subsp. coracana TaxID=191504 RepID=A0AAV5DVP9_ELECO|nr:hypothetical protein PR202_gb01279 [Eleusine coracana subsp. coracana]